MLNGSLEIFALPEVLRFVAAGKITGRIEIEREDVGGELALDQGMFVAARLNEDEAPTTVDEALDAAVLLFDGAGGTFNVVEEDWVGGPLSLDAEAFVSAIDKRREQWAEVVSVLGSLEDPLVLASSLPESTKTVTIDADQWRLLTLVDGTRSVQDVARDSANSVYATALHLAALAQQGMVARGDAKTWTQPVQPTTKKGKKAAAPEAEPDAAEMLHDLADEDAEKQAEEATVRPIRAPTREEQRIRLRR